MNIDDGRCGAWFRDRFQCVKQAGHSKARHEAPIGSGWFRWGAPADVDGRDHA